MWVHLGAICGCDLWVHFWAHLWAQTLGVVVQGQWYLWHLPTDSGAWNAGWWWAPRRRTGRRGDHKQSSPYAGEREVDVREAVGRFGNSLAVSVNWRVSPQGSRTAYVRFEAPEMAEAALSHW